MSGPTTTTMAIRMIGTSFDTATTALATQSISDAQNEINKRLAKRYDFSASPFLTTTTYPPVYVYLIEFLAIGYMYENMSRGSKDSYSRADRYIKKVMSNIEELNEGRAQMVDSAGTLISEIGGEWSVHVTTAYPNTFNEDDSDDWKVSTTKLDDIESDRDE